MKLKIPLVAFLIPLVIILFSFRLVIFDDGFYKAEFEKHGVYELFDKKTADSAIDNLISYMKHGTPLSDFFNEKEKLHMVDVKNIIDKGLILFIILLTISVALLIWKRKDIFRALFYGGIFGLIILLLLFLFAFFSFDSLFYNFHIISFDNELWKLNPQVDNLKAMMPDELFYDALMSVFLMSSIISAVFMGIGFFGYRYKNIPKA